MFLTLLLSVLFFLNTWAAPSIESLSKDIASLQKDLKEANELIVELQDHAVGQIRRKYAWFDGKLINHAVFCLQNEQTQFLVSLESVQPYLNGYKLKFSLGNFYYANCEGISGTIQWHNKKYPSLDKDFDANLKLYNESERKIDFSIAQQVSGGKWNIFEVVAPDMTLEGLSKIRIDADVRTIYLSK